MPASSNDAPTPVKIRPTQRVHSAEIPSGSDLELRQRIAVANAKLQSAAWLIEVLEDLSRCESFVSACHLVTDHLRRHLSAQRVVYIQAETDRPNRVVAVTDTPAIDQESDLARLYCQVAVECADSDQIRIASAVLAQPTESIVGYAQQQLSENQGDVLAIPLFDSQSEPLGCILIVGRVGTLVSHDGLTEFASAIRGPITSVLSQNQRAEGGRWEQLRQRISGLTPSRKLAVLIVSVTAVAAMFVPVTHNVTSDFEVQPTTRNFHVAPFDGLLREMNVVAGDEVVPAQCLARMEDRELLLQIDELNAKRLELAKSQDQEWIAHRAAEAVAAGLQIEQIDAKLSLFNQRLARTELNVSKAGIVLQAPLEDRQNVPVHQGDVIFEIAPLEQLRAAALIPGHDIHHIQTGMQVDLDIDGLGGSSIMGTIDRIMPQATAVNQQHGFIVHCTIDNRDGRLRPGMNGVAKVDAGTKSLGWVLFHRPFDRIARWW
ncbi:efflux RND transporter periplasmic adaptor subunit [Rhodopirellula bahusiensis]|uniref:CusB-like beta-barrel domain-containing protein n=1 Tax=Rhodopirellula bahusiensis TaxID=2014065 RepID=A0A2G1W546_9BACT|nr:efflux RND transporter periplasmic adaptor subunit [Rhodopirellula bahusiensis]PHQ34163.1 hypothetical protein CEE69_16050 [Rhodopirellula bahusiensis]